MSLQTDCGHPLCSEPAVAACEICDTPFCSDHGTGSGDRETPGYAAVAYPAACWKHGGFNADE